MVLLRLFQQIASELRLRLAVAHFNHRLRGEESDADEAFVRAAAAGMKLPVHVGTGDVSGLAASLGISIEMAARRLRHEFLAQAAREFGAAKIALAHHADDQVETFWLRLLRGQVGSGLAGMRWVAPSPGDPSIMLVRPLLNIAKQSILQAAESAGIAFREDSSNSELHFQRNRLRHEVLPVIAQFQPQWRDITLRTMEVLGAEKEFLSLAAAETKDFESAHPALQREIIRAQLLSAGVEPNFELVESLRRSTQQVMIDPDRVVSRDDAGKVTSTFLESHEFDGAECQVDVSTNGWVGWQGLRVDWQTQSASNSAILREKQREWFDADSLGAMVTLRHWRPGDRFQPIGMPEPVKLQNLFTNLKVPAGERHRRLLAVNGSGEIFWVEGLRIGELAKVTPATTRTVRWSWVRE